jgi:plasmid maintenance system killer protein
VTSATLQCTLVIRSFHHRGLKRLYERGDRSGIRPDLLDPVERILTALDAASTPQALDLPGFRLHPLLEGFVVRDGAGQLAHYFSLCRYRRF